MVEAKKEVLLKQQVTRHQTFSSSKMDVNGRPSYTCTEQIRTSCRMHFTDEDDRCRKRTTSMCPYYASASLGAPLRNRVSTAMTRISKYTTSGHGTAVNNRFTRWCTWRFQPDGSNSLTSLERLDLILPMQGRIQAAPKNPLPNELKHRRLRSSVTFGSTHTSVHLGLRRVVTDRANTR